MSLSALNLGPVAVGLLAYAGEVCLETAELETGYEVNVPLSGRLLTRSGPAEVYATPHTAALYRPDGLACGGCHRLAVPNGRVRGHHAARDASVSGAGDGDGNPGTTPVPGNGSPRIRSMMRRPL
jgi:AraC-binding-like domain